MKMLTLFLCLLLGGCGVTDEPYERFAVIVTPCESGSAVAIGEGYFLTATHVILCTDSGKTRISKFVIVRPEGKDTAPVFVDSLDDIVLLYSTLDRDLPLVRVREAEIGEKVRWLQPFITKTAKDTVNIEIYLNQGTVSRISDHYLTVDHIGLPGMSGSGIFAEDGSLVGIGDRLVREFDQIVMFLAVKHSAYDSLYRRMR